jgi:hypothetical protein
MGTWEATSPRTGRCGTLSTSHVQDGIDNIVAARDASKATHYFTPAATSLTPHCYISNTSSPRSVSTKPRKLWTLLSSFYLLHFLSLQLLLSSPLWQVHPL